MLDPIPGTPSDLDLSRLRPDLEAFLRQHGVTFACHAHPPVFTCEEERRHVPESGSARTKNLFLRDRRARRHLLLVTTCEKTVSIAAFAETVAADRLSFASPERLQRFLGVEPGSVTVLGLINDSDRAVELFVDADVWEAPSIHAHPLRNDATLVIDHDGLLKFLAATGHAATVVRVG
jgi:Ala-tRNA(Pro) deacylase